MIDVFAPQGPTPRTIAAICRCPSPEVHASRAAQAATESAQYAQARSDQRARVAEAASAKRVAELQARSPDPDRFAVEDAEQVGDHLVLRVRYPNCAACAYEGSKVLVILKRTLKDAIKWSRIDPHFRDPSTPPSLHEAPSPAARFPGSQGGWTDAIAYANGKARR